MDHYDLNRPVLEHFQVKWIRLAVENAAHFETRLNSASVETALAHRADKSIRFSALNDALLEE